jgi:hypothetical protein
MAMKKIILALFLMASVSAFAQTQPTQPANGQPTVETKEKKEKKDKAEKERKEKKEKKPRTFRLIGVEASRGNNRFQREDAVGTKGNMYEGFIEDGSPFFTYFNNSNTFYSRNDYYLWEYASRQTDFTTTWGFGKRGDVNQKHVIKIGGGYASRYYPTAQYSAIQYFSRDTIGFEYIGNDTVAFIKDTSSFYNSSLQNTLKMGHVNVAYAYRLFPNEKLSLSLGGGVDIGLGTITIDGDIDFFTRSISYGRSITGNSWNYNDYENNTSNSKQIVQIDEKRFKAFMFRPYLSARIDYRISKKFPLLKHINMFTEGRFGMEFSNLNKKFYDGPPPTISLRLGIAYNLFKGL